MRKTSVLAMLAGVVAACLASPSTFATCKQIDEIIKKLHPDGLSVIAFSAIAVSNGGYGSPVWVTVVDETGKICQVANTSYITSPANGRSNVSWLGGRVMSAQKASTANAFSRDNFAISTANLYGSTLPGGSLYGLQHSNPADASRAYAGNPDTYGTKKDPLINKRIGGISALGGGVALYREHEGQKMKIGAIGVSGDTSCTDHVVAWELREILELDKVPAGFLSGPRVLGDEMWLVPTVTPNTVQYPACGGPDGNPAGLSSGVYAP